MSPSSSELSGEAGFSIVETMITMVLLSIALLAICSTLISASATSAFAQQRKDAIDQLRIMSADFSKDVRQGVRVTDAQPAIVTLLSYIDGTLQEVTWEADVTSEGTNLTRLVAGETTAVYVVDLTIEHVFNYDRVAPSDIQRIGLELATQPDPKRPAIEVATTVEMRNVA